MCLRQTRETDSLGQLIVEFGQTSRKTGRQRDRQTADKETKRQRDRKTERQTDDRERKRDIDRETKQHAPFPVHFERASKLQSILRAERFELPTF